MRGLSMECWAKRARLGFHPIMINWIMVCLTTASFSVCINGEAHGFFKAGRGLRQGDPIHLILLLGSGDDLLMLSHGDFSVCFCFQDGVLDDFCLCLVLLPSMSKSEAFFGNVFSSVKADIGLVMPFKEGVLPIKYMGVPMVSKRITDSDCKVMVEVIRKRVGIGELIPSLLLAASHSNCIKIDRILKNFLWTGGGSNKGIVSVSWKEICKPKSQGGLGLRSAHFWNEALLAKHIWNIVSRKDSLWVKWVNVYKLKGRSMWDIELDRGSSWCWKSLLDLRSRIERFVQVKIGNGRDCNIWFDKWHPCGPLSRLITHRIMECADMAVLVSVNVLIEGTIWSGLAIESDVEDKTVWIDKKGKGKRHAFILWVAIKGRLKTLDRILEMGFYSEMGCCVLDKILVDIIRMKLMGLTMKCSPDVLAAASIWNFKINKSDYYKRMVEELLKEDIFNGTELYTMVVWVYDCDDVVVAAGMDLEDFVVVCDVQWEPDWFGFPDIQQRYLVFGKGFIPDEMLI
ncbi:hypothetical protein Tco_0471295 [Tanacetum coccineum]